MGHADDITSSKSESATFTPSSDTGSLIPQVIFFAILLGWSINLLAQTDSWKMQDKLFPYLVGVPFVVLVAAKLFDSTKEFIQEKEYETILNSISEEGRSDKRSLLVWIAVFPGLAYTIGIVFSVPFYFFGFMWFYSRNLSYSIIVAAILTAIIYGLFIFILDIYIYHGILLN